jgi:methylthioribose-1-phosphate isomerase
VSLEPIIWKGEYLSLIDQRILPNEEIYRGITSLEEGHAAIKDMIVRGAPCIGFTAIFTLALAVKNSKEFSLEIFKKDCEYLNTARPTAVNLGFEISKCFDYVSGLLKENQSQVDIYNKLVELGQKELELSHERNLAMANLAMEELKTKSSGPYKVITHCNTGYLACGSLGTALGVISHLHSNKLIDHVYADETRPYMQGSRLTSYELYKENIPHEIIVDGASSLVMKQNKIDAVYVGADRIAANGDTANKIGTSNLAIVAKHFNVPFYVVAPLSSFDNKIETGKDIEIELRPQEEITKYKEHQIAHKDVSAFNPSFDVTDNELITGIIFEFGLLKPPFTQSIKEAYEKSNN